MNLCPWDIRLAELGYLVFSMLFQYVTALLRRRKIDATGGSGTRCIL